MNNKNKLLLGILPFALMSGSALANQETLEFDYFSKEGAAYELLKLPHEERVHKIEEADKIDNLRLISSLHHFIVTTNSHDYKNSEESLLVAFTNAFPVFQNYWDGETTYKGTYVLQKDSLIDLEAVNFFDKPNYINKDAMKYGLPPVGDDGKKVKICLLTQNKASSWFELSQSDLPIFEKALYGNTDFQLLCVDDKHLSDYWQQRVSDFSEYNYDYTERYQYDRGE